MTKNLIRSLAAVAGLSVALAACDGTGPERPSGVTLLLTDAPGNVEQAWVRVDRVYLQGTGGQTDLLPERTDWIELTELAGETTATLVDGIAVPPGTYGQMRFIVTQALLVGPDRTTYGLPGTDFSEFPLERLPDGVDFNGQADGDLHGPSFAQTGIKVGMPAGGFTVPENDFDLTIVVDFDVARSFGREAGASGRWVMHPSLRATDASLSGRIEGDIDVDDEIVLACAGEQGESTFDVSLFTPTADAHPHFATGEVAVTEEDGRVGSYLMAFVHPTSYQMGFFEQATIPGEDGEWIVTFEAQHPEVVPVGEAERVTADYTITGVTCEWVADEE